MPIYEYQCQNCGFLFDELQTMSEKPLFKCPNCGKNELKKLIGSGGGIIFKGSGFYQTDYKNPKEPEKTTAEKSEKTSEKAESKTEPKKEIKTDSKKESKPETKSETKSETKKENKPTTKTEKKK